jgi:tetratricopeptide (TPR) repeat protein
VEGERKRTDLSSYLAREPVILALLSVLAVVLFLAVTGLSHVYHRQQDFLGQRWYHRGVADLEAHRFGIAVTEFRTALLYSRDSYSYQLDLAEALLGLNKTDEAHAYLINLWDRQPENGLVNLELARIAAGQGETERALRYYHNAIYATWPSDQDYRRQDTRLELIEFLLRSNAKTAAQSELIALAANLGSDPAQQAHLGGLFYQAGDYEHALAAYRSSLKSDRHDHVALAGAGLAAFELGRYSVAQRYLQAAAAAAPDDREITAKLRTVDLVLQMDPFRRQISSAQRNRIVVAAFAAAGSRLASCGAIRGSTIPVSSLQNLATAWAKLKPKITTYGLRRDPDLVNTAMELIFNIERQANGGCGPPTETDTALFLIARLHEGN